MGIRPILTVATIVYIELAALVATVMIVEEVAFILCEWWASLWMVIISLIGAVVEGALVVIPVPVVAIIMHSCVVLAIAIVVVCLHVSVVLVTTIIVTVFVSMITIVSAMI